MSTQTPTRGITLFFQAEDGIRDYKVTGVQTCALPIFGLLSHSDAEERFTRTEEELKALMAIAFGGMVAEELAFGAASTGPAGDLSYATALAAQMVGSYGMGGTLISFEAVEAGPMSAGIVAKVLSNSDARKRVEVLLLEAKETARPLLAEHRHLIEALGASLMECNELAGDRKSNR